MQVNEEKKGRRRNINNREYVIIVIVIHFIYMALFKKHNVLQKQE